MWVESGSPKDDYCKQSTGFLRFISIITHHFIKLNNFFYTIAQKYAFTCKTDFFEKHSTIFDTKSVDFNKEFPHFKKFTIEFEK